MAKEFNVIEIALVDPNEKFRECHANNCVEQHKKKLEKEFYSIKDNKNKSYQVSLASQEIDQIKKEAYKRFRIAKAVC